MLLNDGQQFLITKFLPYAILLPYLIVQKGLDNLQMDYLLIHVQLPVDLLPYTNDPIIGRSDHIDRWTLGKGKRQHQFLQTNRKDKFQLLNLYLLELLLNLQVDQLLYEFTPCLAENDKVLYHLPQGT